jgi:hypothetical protein
MAEVDRERFASAVMELRESIAARRRLPIDSPEHGPMLAHQIELSTEIRRLAEHVHREASNPEGSGSTGG